MKIIMSMLCAIVILLSCNNNTADKTQKDYSIIGNQIKIKENSSLLRKLTTQDVKTTEYSKEFHSTGTIKAIPNQYAQIAAPFTGRITKSHIRLGQHIKKDEPIFEINSSDFFDASNSFFQSKQEMQLALKNLNRQKDLAKNGVGTQKDLEEAEVNYAIKEKDFENAKLSLNVFQVNADKLIPGQSLIVRSPIEGEVIDNKIVIGQYIKEDQEPIAIVAELKKVWVVGQVKEKDINNISKDSDVEICTSANSCIKARVYHISDILDEETRSVQVYIECSNPNRVLKPGMYASVKFINAAKKSIIIPSSAVLQMENSNYVFVEISKNIFERREIQATTISTDKLLITSGLTQGERIVSEGSYFLMQLK